MILEFIATLILLLLLPYVLGFILSITLITWGLFYRLMNHKF